MKLIITRISRSSKDKDGNPFMGKNGKPYTRIGFKCNEYGDKWVSGFGNQANNEWQEGDTVDVDIEEKGQYLNFKMKSMNPTWKDFNDLQERVRQLEMVRFDVSNTEACNPDNDEQDDELPF